MPTSSTLSVALDRKLTEEESRELRILLMPYFHTAAIGEDNNAAAVAPEDINDFLDYAFAMVNNKKSVEYVIKELVGMEMEFCTPAVAEKVGDELSGFLQKLVNGQEEGGEGDAERKEPEDKDGADAKKSKISTSKVDYRKEDEVSVDEPT